MTERRRLWILGIAAGVVLLGTIAIARSDSQERQAVSRCTRCGVVQYRWYYVIDLWGWRLRLPGTLDVSGSAPNTCAHQIQWIHGPSY